MKRPRPKPAPASDADPLTDAVDRLADEVRALSEVMDNIREDFSWVTRNGLPVQPIEHVHVKRMARDPCAGDWAEQLEIERSDIQQCASASSLDTVALDRMADYLAATVEALAQGQLDIVLEAIEGVRNQLLTAVRKDSGPPLAAPAAPQSPSTLPARDKPQTGRLF